ALTAVAAHQSAVGVLPAVVTSQQLQAHVDAPGVITCVQTKQAELVERVEIAKAQVFPPDNSPLLGRVVGKKLALIEADRRLECRLCLHEFCAGEVLTGRLQPLLESLNINPDVERWLDKVSLVPVDHHRSVPGHGAQGLAKPMYGNVQ